MVVCEDSRFRVTDNNVVSLRGGVETKVGGVRREEYLYYVFGLCTFLNLKTVTYMSNYYYRNKRKNRF